MRQLVTVAALMALGAAHAATTYSVNGVLYVNLREFAAENGMTYRSDVNGIVLKSGSKAVKLFPYSTAATLNGVKFTLTGAVQMEGGVPSAPLLNLQRAFGLASQPAAAAQAPAAAPTPPTTPAAPPTPYQVSQVTTPADFGDLFGTSLGDSIRLNSKPALSTVFTACRAYAESRLKSPASAQYSFERVTVYPADMWTVTGTVDSQNAYGAMLRSSYYCFARWQAGELQLVVELVARR